jgi:hypothetical protein
MLLAGPGDGPGQVLADLPVCDQCVELSRMLVVVQSVAACQKDTAQTQVPALFRNAKRQAHRS